MDGYLERRRMGFSIRRVNVEQIKEEIEEENEILHGCNPSLKDEEDEEGEK